MSELLFPHAAGTAAARGAERPPDGQDPAQTRPAGTRTERERASPAALSDAEGATSKRDDPANADERGDSGPAAQLIVLVLHRSYTPCQSLGMTAGTQGHRCANLGRTTVTDVKAHPIEERDKFVSRRRAGTGVSPCRRPPTSRLPVRLGRLRCRVTPWHDQESHTRSRTITAGQRLNRVIARVTATSSTRASLSRPARGAAFT